MSSANWNQRTIYIEDIYVRVGRRKDLGVEDLGGIGGNMRVHVVKIHFIHPFYTLLKE